MTSEMMKQIIDYSKSSRPMVIAANSAHCASFHLAVVPADVAWHTVADAVEPSSQLDHQGV